jgi:[ribosomal protein S5]-alanine N-acetyltransferase
MADRTFTPFPMLTTERLMLRQLSANDQQNIFALRSNVEIIRYLDRPIARSIEDAMNFINKINENIKNDHSVYWVITLTKTRTFVGTICLFDFSNGKSSCEIGYELMTEFQGRGIMKEAAEEVINYAFATLQFQKIVAFTHGDNQRSNKLLSKLNFIKSIKGDSENGDFDIYNLTYSHWQTK